MISNSLILLALYLSTIYGFRGFYSSRFLTSINEGKVRQTKLHTVTITRKPNVEIPNQKEKKVVSRTKEKSRKDNVQPNFQQHVKQQDNNIDTRQYIQDELFLINWSNITIEEAMKTLFDPKYYYPRVIHSRKQQEYHLAKFLLNFYTKMNENHLYDFIMNCKKHKLNPMNILPIKFMKEKLITCLDGRENSVGSSGSSGNNFVNKSKKLSLKGLEACLQYLTWADSTITALSITSFVNYLIYKVKENQELFLFPQTVSSGLSGLYHLTYTNEVEELISLLHERLAQAPTRGDTEHSLTLDQYAKALGGMSNFPFHNSTVLQSFIFHVISIVQIDSTNSLPEGVGHLTADNKWTISQIVAGFYGMKDLRITNPLTESYLSLMETKLAQSNHKSFTSEDILFIFKGIRNLDIFHPTVQLIHQHLMTIIRSSKILFNRSQTLTILRYWNQYLETPDLSLIHSYHNNTTMIQLLLTIYDAMPLDLWFYPKQSIYYEPILSNDFYQKDTIYREFKSFIINSLLPYQFIKHSDRSLQSFYLIFKEKLTQQIQSFQQQKEKESAMKDDQQAKKKKGKQLSLQEGREGQHRQNYRYLLTKEQIVTIFALFPFHQASPLEQPEVIGITEQLYELILLTDYINDFTIEEMTKILAHLRYIIPYDNLSSIGMKYVHLFVKQIQKIQQQSKTSSELTVEELARLVTGISSASSDRSDVQELLQFITPQLKTVNPTSYLSMLHALSGMTDEQPAVRQFLKALTDAVYPREFGVVSSGHLAGGYYGIHRMSSKYDEVIDVLRLLNDQWEVNPPMVETLHQTRCLLKAMSSIMIGLSNMNPKDHNEVRRSINIVIKTISSSLIPMRAEFIVNCVTGK